MSLLRDHESVTSIRPTLVIVAYEFPPENTSGAARPYRFFRYLPEAGVDPIVITASPQDVKNDRIFHVPDTCRDHPRESLMWYAEVLVRYFLLPGELGLAWSRDVARFWRNFSSPSKRLAVLSTSPPFSTHLAALRLKRQFQVPVIVDFRDPFTLDTRTGRSGRFDRYRFIESRLVNGADAVIANTDVMGDLWRARYPERAAGVHVLWNGFDPEDEVTASPLPPGPVRRLSHIGDIYAGRHPGTILHAIDRLSRAGRVQPSTLQLSLVGWSRDECIPDLGLLRRLETEGFVVYRPHRVPREEARLLARSADALVLLQPQTPLQVPAKLFEYIRIGRPILANVMRDSPSERILARSNVPFQAIYPDDNPAEIDAKILEFLTLPNTSASPSEWFVENFDARRQAETLASVVRDVTQNSVI